MIFSCTFLALSFSIGMKDLRSLGRQGRAKARHGRRATGAYCGLCLERIHKVTPVAGLHYLPCIIYGELGRACAFPGWLGGLRDIAYAVCL